jgi:hypothetical protein
MESLRILFVEKLEEDPVLLRARIAELEEELLTKGRDAYERGYSHGYGVGYAKALDSAACDRII